MPEYGRMLVKRNSNIDDLVGIFVPEHVVFVQFKQENQQVFDLAEPPRVADAGAKMGLRHCVLTSVARDDLPLMEAKQGYNSSRSSP